MQAAVYGWWRRHERIARMKEHVRRQWCVLKEGCLALVFIKSFFCLWPEPYILPFDFHDNHMKLVQLPHCRDLETYVQRCYRFAQDNTSKW